jgi:hypothetical protein
MILAAREAGDLAQQGRPENLTSEEVSRLSDYGISYNLAAHAVALAGVPDEDQRPR